MQWETYDAFERPEEWPGSRWEKADLGNGPLWDETTTTCCSSVPKHALMIRIPRFTLFRPPSHSKALMLSTRRFEVAPGSSFGARCNLAVEIFGTERNPFGVEAGDPRLACGGMVTIDVGTGVVFDFLVTNDHIFAVYERLPYAQRTMGSYPAFTHLIPAHIPTYRGQPHLFEIRYNALLDLAEWIVDGRQVAHHAPIGAPWRQSHPIVKLSVLRIGGSLFTFMDGGLSNKGG